jgi:hypothetical protein
LNNNISKTHNQTVSHPSDNIPPSSPYHLPSPEPTIVNIETRL